MVERAHVSRLYGTKRVGKSRETTQRDRARLLKRERKKRRRERKRESKKENHQKGRDRRSGETERR